MQLADSAHVVGTSAFHFAFHEQRFEVCYRFMHNAFAVFVVFSSLVFASPDIGFVQHQIYQQISEIVLCGKALRFGMKCSSRLIQAVAAAQSRRLSEHVSMVFRSALFCRKRDGISVIEPCTESAGALFRPHELRDALDAEEEPLPVSARILRGDFDA